MVVCGLCLGHTNRLVVHVQFLISFVFYEINALFLHFFAQKTVTETVTYKMRKLLAIRRHILV